MDKMTPTINEFANYYEFRGDYDHTPTDGERTMIEDAITGYLEDTGLAQAHTTLQGERDRLREALRVFANIPLVGKRGGPFVIGKTLYEDMRNKDAGPRASYFHKSDLLKARAALNPSTGVEGEAG